MSNLDMSKLVNLNCVGAIRDWVRENFLLKSAAEQMMSSKIKITFGSDFNGETYTITGGANETYTGNVPSTLIVEQTIKTLHTDYTVSCNTAESVNYEQTVNVGSYYGIYPITLMSFLVYLECSADADAVVTAVCGAKTYTGTADSNGKCTLNIKEAGTYSVTATLNGETTHPVSVEITTPDSTYTCALPSLLFRIVPWSTGTDEEIAIMLDYAKAGTIDLHADGNWAIGDKRTIQTTEFTAGASTIHESQSVDIVISSFEDYNKCGCVMQFDFKNSLAKITRMNIVNTNEGGYKASAMFNITLPALAKALPTWLSSRLIEFDVLASAGSSSNTIETISGNKLALRSEIEIFGTASYTKKGEGTRIEYYKTDANRVKKSGHNDLASYWWGRSPGLGRTQFGCVNASGNTTSRDADDINGVAPFGCI